MADKQIGAPLFEDQEWKVLHVRWANCYHEMDREAIVLVHHEQMVWHCHPRGFWRSRPKAECVVMALTEMQRLKAEALAEQSEHESLRELTQQILADRLIPGMD